MTIREEKITSCHICPNHCFFNVTIEDGKILDIKGAEGFPVHICSVQKGADHVIGTVESKNRLTKPLRRVGKKGSGKWKEITWDAALDEIADKLLEVKEKYGPERLVMILGEPKGMEFAMGQRFASAFGTPNTVTPGNYCGVQCTESCSFTFGSRYIQARMEGEPKSMVIWGSNPAHTGGTFNMIGRYDMNRCITNGMKVIIIDPKNIELWPEKGMHASDCDYWLRARPNSDGVLAMGLNKVIIEEGLYDKKYIDEWTLGFDDIVQECKTFTLDEVADLTWVPKEQIIEVARVIAGNAPSVIATGNALEGSVSSFQTLRAINVIRGLTANVNTPTAGFCEIECAEYKRTGSFMIGDIKDILRKYPRSPERTIGGFETGMAARFGYVPTQTLIRALLEENPYLPKVGIGFVNNPLLTYPDSRATAEAFKKFDLLVYSELFPTATTNISDIVLPAAMMHEHDTVAYWPAWHGGIRANVRLVDPPGEAWSDMKFINELAKRVGLNDYFWDHEEQILDYMCEPLGLTWKQFRDEVHYVRGKWKYDPERIVGYGTPSGKVELRCDTLKKYGADPVPRFKHVKAPLQGLFDITEEYPLIMTNYKSEIMMLSGYRCVERLMKKSLPPTTYLSPETAKEYGIEEGDWIWIETYRGRMKQQARLQEGTHPKVVNVEFGWGDWVYPEANQNIITDYRKPWDNDTGSCTIRGYACKIYKVKEEE